MGKLKKKQNGSKMMIVGEHHVPTRRGWVGRSRMIDVTGLSQATATTPKKRSLSPLLHYNDSGGEEVAPSEKRQRRTGRVSEPFL